MNVLGKYLDEHLSGSHAALKLLAALAEGDSSSRATCEDLRTGIIQNRLVPETLMPQVGFSQSRGMLFAARLVSEPALLRFRSHGMEQGRPGLVEALEALELGVHGQTLLWRGLLRHQPMVPSWRDADFGALLRTAENQKAVVESLRTGALKKAFFDRGD